MTRPIKSTPRWMPLPSTGDKREAWIHTPLHRAQEPVGPNVTFAFSQSTSRPQQILNEMAHGRPPRPDHCRCGSLDIAHTVHCLVTYLCPSCKNTVCYTGSSVIQMINLTKVCGDAQLSAAQISPIVNPLNNAQDTARPLVEWERTLLGNPCC